MEHSPEPIRYTQKPRPTGLPVSYRLEGSVLTVDSTRKIDTLDLATVVLVRYIFQPSTISSRGFRTKLTFHGGKVLTFGNVSWRSLAVLDNDDPAYRTFTTAVATAIGKTAPKARFVAGKPMLLWLLFSGIAVGAALGLVGFSVAAFIRGQSNAGFLGLFMAGLTFWQLKPMVVLNRPRDVPHGTVPQELLP